MVASLNGAMGLEVIQQFGTWRIYIRSANEPAHRCQPSSKASADLAALVSS